MTICRRFEWLVEILLPFIKKGDSKSFLDQLFLPSITKRYSYVLATAKFSMKTSENWFLERFGAGEAES